MSSLIYFCQQLCEAFHSKKIDIIAPQFGDVAQLLHDLVTWHNWKWGLSYWKQVQVEVEKRGVDKVQAPKMDDLNILVVEKLNSVELIVKWTQVCRRGVKGRNYTKETQHQTPLDQVLVL